MESELYGCYYKVQSKLYPNQEDFSITLSLASFIMKIQVQKLEQIEQKQFYIFNLSILSICYASTSSFSLPFKLPTYSGCLNILLCKHLF